MLVGLLPWAALLLADEPAPARRTAFPGSLAPVPPGAHDLTVQQPVDAGETVRFQVALRLSPGGQAPEAAYAALVRWLREQGLTVTESTPALHWMVQAEGTVGQVGKALAVRFGRVVIGSRAWVAAVSAPSLPAALGGEVIGINGLQPFLRMHKGPIRARPAADR